MKKALIVASVASMIDQFNMSNIRLLLQMGYEVHVACNYKKGSTCSEEKITSLKEKLHTLDVTIYQIDFARNILKVAENFKAYKQLKRIVKNNGYEIIHCHSPIGGLLTRLAAKKERKKGTRVIYTAHGFHFYKGAPKKNWLLYYPVEKMCSRWTDTLITINREDYELAQKKMKAEKVVYIPGVGIDVDKFTNTFVDSIVKRQELGIPANAFFLLSVGELNENKNHKTVVKAMAKLDNKNVYYAVAGKGDLHDELLSLASDLGLNKRFKLLGFRSDVDELYKIADCFVHPSFREGLPVSIMEAMASGLPVLCSAIRGNVDLIDVNGGWLFDSQKEDECQRALSEAICCDLKAMGQYNLEKAKQFELGNIISIMREIYGRGSH